MNRMPAIVDGTRTAPWHDCWLARVNGVPVMYEFDAGRRALVYRLPGGSGATAAELHSRGFALRLPAILRPGIAPGLEG